MTNPYLDPTLHDADLHVEWFRVDTQLQHALESSDEDLRDSLAMERDQISEAVRTRWLACALELGIPAGPPHAAPQPGSRDPSPLQAF